MFSIKDAQYRLRSAKQGNDLKEPLQARVQAVTDQMMVKRNILV